MFKKFIRVFIVFSMILGIFFLWPRTIIAANYADSLNERILLFESNINIDPETGQLHVVENIKVNVQNISIVHGIFRDFPVVYKSKDTGETYKVKFRLVSTKLDGKPVDNQTERIDGGIRIYLGDSEHTVTKGVHTYTIEYKTSRQLGFPPDYPNFVELYWNVNGTGWKFPIDKVVAKVALPKGLTQDKIKYTGFTGKFGEAGKDYKAYVADSYVVFETLRNFQPGENLTISILFPKEYIHVNPNSLKNRLLDNLGLLIAFVGFVLVSTVAYKIWSKVGRDPELGSIMPMFNIPQNLDPVSIRFLYKLRNTYVDNKSLTSALIYLAVNGYIRIHEHTKGDFKIELINYPADTNSWEYEFVKNILSKDKPWELKNDWKTANKVNQALAILRKYTQKNAKALYDMNIKQIVIVMALYILVSIVALIIAYLNIELTFDSWMIIIVFGSMFLPFFLTFYILIRNKGKFNKFWPLLIMAFGLLYFGLLALGNILWAVVLTLYIMALMFVYELFPRFSEEGIKLYRAILGFREYLSTAEEDRLNVLNPPELTPELFEKYLPYAMALDVEHKWAKKFEKVFKKLREQGQEYLTTWYNVGYNMTLNERLVKLTDHISTSMASTITSAVKVSSASTGGFSGGFSGGGFSGGGGGGGGGGGW